MAVPVQTPEPVFLLERWQNFGRGRQHVCVVRVIAGKGSGQRVGEGEGFFASEVPHQKLILPIRRSLRPGLEGSDQLLRVGLFAGHGYPFDPIARLKV